MPKEEAATSNAGSYVWTSGNDLLKEIRLTWTRHTQIKFPQLTLMCYEQRVGRPTCFITLLA